MGKLLFRSTPNLGTPHSLRHETRMSPYVKSVLYVWNQGCLTSEVTVEDINGTPKPLSSKIIVEILCVQTFSGRETRRGST